MNQVSQKQLTQNRWIWSTTAGWFIGILLVVGFAMLAEIILQTNDESGGQAAVGIGMGTGVGLMQWIVLRKYLESIQKWLWFLIIGFTISYVSFDLIAANIDLAIKAEVSLPFATTLGALISSWLHYRFILRNITSKAANWIAYNTIAWLLAHLINYLRYVSDKYENII
ncbi:MAG: hypothetical protein AABY93_07735 [Bacteroidota bacterium]